MYGVCLQTKPSKTVHSFMHDKRKSALWGETKKLLVLIGLTDT